MAQAVYLTVPANQVLDLASNNAVPLLLQYVINRRYVAADPQNGIYVVVPALGPNIAMSPDFATQ